MTAAPGGPGGVGTPHQTPASVATGGDSAAGAVPTATSRAGAAVITCSDTAAAGEAIDTSGPLAAELLGVPRA